MSVTYSWYYGMYKVKTWLGPEKPDEPHPPSLELEENVEEEESDSDSQSTPNTKAEPSTQDGYLGFGVHLQDPLYVDPEVRKVIRLYQYSDIQKSFPGCTKKQLNRFRDAYSIGIFRNASLTISAVDEKHVYPLFGAKHTTTIVVSSCAVLDELSNFFSEKAFKVGPANVLYRVVPGSFQLKTPRQKPDPVA